MPRLFGPTGPLNDGFFSHFRRMLDDMQLAFSRTPSAVAQKDTDPGELPAGTECLILDQAALGRLIRDRAFAPGSVTIVKIVYEFSETTGKITTRVYYKERHD